jgi:hypothetical protein
MESPIIIKNGHALQIGGVMLRAVIDGNVFWIEQSGSVLNGDAQTTVDAAVVLHEQDLQSKVERPRAARRAVSKS